MEIILALMALAATPFGAAMLDKPTRKRVIKTVKAHSPLTKRLTMAEALKMEPRNKDWAAEDALKALWMDAMVWYSVPDREQTMRSLAEKIERHLAKLEQWNKAVKTYDDCSYYDEVLWQARYNAKEEIRFADRTLRNSLTSDELALSPLYAKYGREVFYKNDLVRLAGAEKLPHVDFIALTAYTSK